VNGVLAINLINTTSGLPLMAGSTIPGGVHLQRDACNPDGASAQSVSGFAVRLDTHQSPGAGHGK
jgi:hypothetical protein